MIFPRLKWFILGIFIFLFWGIASANVTVTDQITVPLTIGSETIDFQLTPVSGLTEFSVASDKINITAGTTPARFQGPTDISFGAATDCTVTGKSTIEVPANASRTITPLKPAVGSAEYKENTCEGRRSSGGGGGGGTSGTTAAPPPPTPPTPLVPTPPETPTVEEPEKLEFKDVPGSGKKKVTKKSADAIMRVSLLMLEKGSYTWPTNKKFYPHNPTPILAALQMSLAVSGNGCEGKTPSGKNCLTAAIAAGIVDEKESTKLPKKPTRVLYYEMLLNAAKIPLLTKEEITDDYLCRDVKAKSREAPVVATARAYGIASVYKGKKCNVKKQFKKWEAAVFASRTLDAMEALKAQPTE